MSISVIVKIVVTVLILGGTALSILSAFGMLRLPDVYTRTHAATKSTTLGVLCTLLGTFLYFWQTQDIVSIRLLLGIVFVFLTAPVAGHLICRAAYRSGVELAQESTEDELKKVLDKREKREN
ncbi:Na+/H+ antiporter subunit G [Desulforamulus aeronauticus]|uniref:Multicomponent Na+:H+ antiporter subunit G n=1 Tax=Desulforamulus aeronauticus DSM 10349 TaxID=1121421 RepID=A0A1M6NP85_9FIRM|nr:Na+/H+ antiporter subunit G [Desulforamulus aeronauticus]SHJ97513.1 multicomponent Na+:H+ antiporter subunit G [Desulforamulus aeronauticus DSM 10349]